MNDKILTEGVVIDALPNATYEVELENGSKVSAHISSDLRKKMVKINPDDKVKVALSPLNLSKGRIVEKLD